MKILARNQNNPKWDVVQSREYKGETDLQKLLADSPTLISIQEIRTDTSPLLIAVREIGLPGSGHTDIVAFSAAGDMAIVECKLAANAEIKRKVIGQALEYGAYLWKMPYEALDEKIEARSGKNLADLVRENVGTEDWDEEDFRATISETLDKGNFILIIAVDEINEELARTIHFLNGCGQPAFAFAAIELRRFQADETEILVPKIVGSSLIDQKGSIRKRWTETRFFEVINKDLSKETATIISGIYLWAKGKSDEISFGTGIESGSFTFWYKKENQNISVFTINTKGYLTINFGAFGTVMSKDIVESFRHKLLEVPSLAGTLDLSKFFPSVKVESVFLHHPDSLEKFKQVIEGLRSIIYSEPIN